MRAVFALLRTQVFGKYPGVHRSVNAARKSARATGRLHHLWWASRPMETPLTVAASVSVTRTRAVGTSAIA